MNGKRSLLKVRSEIRSTRRLPVLIRSKKLVRINKIHNSPNSKHNRNKCLSKLQHTFLLHQILCQNRWCMCLDSNLYQCLHRFNMFQDSLLWCLHHNNSISPIKCPCPIYLCSLHLIILIQFLHLHQLSIYQLNKSQVLLFRLMKYFQKWPNMVKNNYASSKRKRWKNLKINQFNKI
jgi:hypothetical protein